MHTQPLLIPLSAPRSSYIELLKEVISQAGEHGILVVLLAEGSSDGFHIGGWYNIMPKSVLGYAKLRQRGRVAAQEVTPAVVDASWGKIAGLFCSSWNVFAVDLQVCACKIATQAARPDASRHDLNLNPILLCASL